MFSSVHAIGFCLPSLPLKLRKESESKQFQAGDFPGSPVDKNLLCNAGNEGLIPGQGAKIPHAVEQVSPLPTTTEFMCHNI